MFLKELTHTEIIWIASLQVRTSNFTTDFMFYTGKGKQQRNLLCFASTGFTLSFKQNIPTALLANESGVL